MHFLNTANRKTKVHEYKKSERKSNLLKKSLLLGVKYPVWVSASLQRCKFLFLRLVSPEAHAMSLIIHLLQEDKGLINSNKGKRNLKNECMLYEYK